ncbi:MAG: phosphotransferase [Xanthomonadales bacterium]|jgi:aminoglycoside/choline kinase family phosphotransferase|nr:phosphotransferase [Xanthomonadales bacterium]
MANNGKKSRDRRREDAAVWAAGRMGLEQVDLQPVCGDASFRRYFRFDANGRSVILMDAPRYRENSKRFLDAGARLKSAGLKTPDIYHFDLDLGFGLLEDFGDVLFRDILTEDTVDTLFPRLFEVLEVQARQADSFGLPEYNEERLQMELDLFPDWYLAQHKHRPLSASDRTAWQDMCGLLIESARKQPQVFVHRDFHSCNLLDLNGETGIIDFQDALHGPISYDFVSLIWDRYIAWPRDRLEAWMAEMHVRHDLDCSLQEWIRQCDWMGLQRNIKIAGIFARLRYRDAKTGYIQMIPLFYRYLLDVVPLYPEFRGFLELLEREECAP